mgnify:CR=1 FL=1|tara:strand:- start:27 stop:200 length:174 start_codon:yes stop_codon:yes gene_type:complete
MKTKSKKTEPTKKVVSSTKKSNNCKNDEWLIEKMGEITNILEEHDKIIKKIKLRMGL